MENQTNRDCSDSMSRNLDGRGLLRRQSLVSLNNGTAKPERKVTEGTQRSNLAEEGTKPHQASEDRWCASITSRSPMGSFSLSNPTRGMDGMTKD